MGIVWDWKDKIGTCKITQSINGKDKEFSLAIYKGNAYAIFVYHYEEDGKKLYHLQNLFCDQEHAKRMLGLDKKWKDTYGRNPMDEGFDQYTEFTFDPRRKEAKQLAKLLIDAKWKKYPTIRFEEGGEE